MEEAPLHARSVAKLFAFVAVLKDLDFAVPAGRLAVIFGPNGIGKSTIIRLAAGLSRPDEGEVWVLGHRADQLSAGQRRGVGVLLHQSMLYGNLSAAENLEFYAALAGVTQPRQRAAGWLERLGLSAHAERRVRAFSRGMEQRLAVARCMIAEPSVILLDEPFAALDGDGVERMVEVLTEALARGASIVLTAHAPLNWPSSQCDQYELVGGNLKPLPAEPQEQLPPTVARKYGG